MSFFFLLSKFTFNQSDASITYCLFLWCNLIRLYNIGRDKSRPY